MRKDSHWTLIESKGNKKSFLESISSDKHKIQNTLQNLRLDKNWKIGIHDLKIDPRSKYAHLFGSPEKQMEIIKHIMRKRNIFNEIP